MTWVSARQNDPVPIMLTAGGCLLSVAALVVGLSYDRSGVMSNILADLVLVGPALFLSNIIVKRFQDARAQRRITPLIDIVAQLLRATTATVDQAFEMLGIQPDPATDSSAGRDRTLAGIADELAEASTYLDTHLIGRVLPTNCPVIADLTFPRFGTIRKLVQQADQSYPMPRSVAASNIAEEWDQRCCVDFIYVLDGHDMRRRHIGLTQVEARSRPAGPITRVCTDTYLDAVRGCLRAAHGIASQMAIEIATVNLHAVPIRLADLDEAVAP
jgi:hypothetical protein